MKYTREQLVDIIAKTMRYASSHFDDETRESNPEGFSFAMESVSMCVACWLAQNTVDGAWGVEWEVVYDELCNSKWTTATEYFAGVADRLIEELGGVRDA